MWVKTIFVSKYFHICSCDRHIYQKWHFIHGVRSQSCVQWELKHKRHDQTVWDTWTPQLWLNELTGWLTHVLYQTVLFLSLLKVVFLQNWHTWNILHIKRIVHLEMIIIYSPNRKGDILKNINNNTGPHWLSLYGNLSLQNIFFWVQMIWGWINDHFWLNYLFIQSTLKYEEQNVSLDLQRYLKQLVLYVQLQEYL